MRLSRFFPNTMGLLICLCAHVPYAASAASAPPMATPPGVTLLEEPPPVPSGGGVFRFVAPGLAPLSFGDSEGLALYTYGKDEPGKSHCVDACAKAWPPFVAGKNAKAVGPWTAIARPDGTKQWAYDNKPLYTWMRDIQQRKVAEAIAAGGPPPAPAPEPTAQANVASATAGTSGDAKPTAISEGASASSKLPEGWATVAFNPGAKLVYPPGVRTRTVTDAAGVGLVDRNGMTLYAFDGNVKDDKQSCVIGSSCIEKWLPLTAPATVGTVGDFTAITRPDGMRQWAYKGKALYTYFDDLAPGDANGRNADKNFHVALLTAFFTPPGVRIETRTHDHTLVTPDGKTLYTRGPGSRTRTDIHDGFSRQYAQQKALGTRGCNAECLKTWHPFLAPADAQASGFWEVLVRADGARQWAYKGAALYTYSGDLKPGDVNGNNIMELSVDGKGPYTVAEGGGGPASSLSWHTAVP